MDSPYGHRSIPAWNARYVKHSEAEDVVSAYVSPLAIDSPDTTMKPYWPVTTNQPLSGTTQRNVI